LVLAEVADVAFAGFVAWSGAGALALETFLADALLGELGFAVLFLAAIRSSIATHPGRRFRAPKLSRSLDLAILRGSPGPCRGQRFE